MAFRIETFGSDSFPEEAAKRIADAFPGGGSLVLTGGSTAEKVYPYLGAHKKDWSGVEIAFSDERCVPPDDRKSNYFMAKRTLLDAAGPGVVHRIKGELPPQQGAQDYHEAMRPLVGHGFDLLLLGVGTDAHVGSMSPGSPALSETRYAAAVTRYDGVPGVTLTPPAMLSARRVLLIVTGEAKADVVRRAVETDEPIDSCPVRLLADHPDATFLLDEQAASLLSEAAAT